MTARAVALDTLRALTAEDLAAHLREQRGQLFQVRLQQTIGQVDDHRQIRAIRREIARTMTVQVEYRLAVERGEEVPTAAAAAPESRRRRARQTAEPASAPARSRRFRAAAAAAAELAQPAPAPVDDEPSIEAISDIEVERIDDPDAGSDDATADAVAISHDTKNTGAAAAADKDQT